MREYFSMFFGKFTEDPVVTGIALTGIILLAAILFIISRQKMSTRTLAVGAISVAIAYVLSFITLYKMPYGGSVTPASMLPIIAFAWAFGAPAGIVAGIAYGLLQMTQGLYFMHPVQFLFDYILPFAMLGFAGFFKGKSLLLAILVAGLLRFLCHFLAGAVFWGMYAAEGQSPWMYSLIYNGSYMLPEIIVCMVIAAIPAMRKFILELRPEGAKA
ncbi:MAG: energy-coupled thiamine transporter ThiT [Clostridia bacterium]|nr:energy-coupled thiamine transporter ThiT [Clostridia bacterium]